MSLGLRTFRCPACGPSLLLRFGPDEMQVRCLRCRGTPVHLSLIAAIGAHVPALRGRRAYELSTVGPVPRWLRKHSRAVTTSEFLAGVAPGSCQRGIRCEDVQRLSFADASFDLCTATEVFEHVPDDAAGLRELHRVLGPGGWLLMTVPMSGSPATVERARREGDALVHMLPPAYHGDRLNGPGTVLVYRDYGSDLVERTRMAGFARAHLWAPPRDFLGHARQVLVAQR